MSDLQDIAKSIDKLNLSEMLERAENTKNGSLPRAGGVYDTKSGWAKRLWGGNGGGLYHKFDKLLTQLVADGLAEDNITGLVPLGTHWRRGVLIKSEWLEGQAAQNGSESGDAPKAAAPGPLQRF